MIVNFDACETNTYSNRALKTNNPTLYSQRPTSEIITFFSPRDFPSFVSQKSFVKMRFLVSKKDFFFSIHSCLVVYSFVQSLSTFEMLPLISILKNFEKRQKLWVGKNLENQPKWVQKTLENFEI